MINAIQYIYAGQSLAADKNVAERNKWHLSSVKGTDLPSLDALGGQSFGLAGRSFNGVSVDGRSIDVSMYADGYSALSKQEMYKDISRVVTSAGNDLGILRLQNAAGEWYRIQARCVDFEQSKEHRRAALMHAVFWCPYVYFEDDVLHRAPVWTISGGKEWELERPYTFSNIESITGTETLELYNAGDIDAPVRISLHGQTLTAVIITNNTTGAEIQISGMPGADGITINTDANDVSAVFANGDDARAYVSMYHSISDFVLASGNNNVTIQLSAGAIDAAGCEIDWRGRYSLCL